MPHLHLTDLKLKSLAKHPPEKSKQIDYFDDATKGGVRGLLLKHSYGGTLAWYCMFYEGGKSKLFKLGKYPVLKLAAARQAALEFLANPKKHTENRAAPETFGAVVEKFLELHVEKKKVRSAKIIKQRIDKHLLPTFKDYQFASIRRRDLVEVLDQVEADHGAAMADAILGIFRSIANWVCSRDEDYRSPIGPGMKRAKSNRRERVLDDAELKVFWDATGELGIFGSMLRLLLLTGQRRAKVNLLKWSDIKNGVWTIHTELNEKPNPGRIKLPPMALDIIDAQPRLRKNPYVFPGLRKRGAFSAWGQYTAKLDELMRKSLPEMKPHTVHDLRRTFRSRLSRIGIEPHVAERCLGHIVGNQIERTYDQHPFYEEMSAAYAAFATHVHDLVTPPPDNLLRISSRRKAMAPANG